MSKKAIFLSVKIALLSVILLLSALLLISIADLLEEHFHNGINANAEYNTSPMIVIDAGHGGEDGGAIGVNGCIEKELNLDIALITYDLLRASGVNAVLTRSEDVLLYDKDTPGKKKAQDVRNRVAIAEEYDNSILISIHMNTYPAAKYSGAQIYYSPNRPESEVIAKTCQENIKEYLQPNNTRETKPATSAIYLLHNVQRPAVLVECGFISNQEEAELLSTEGYRHKVACIIYASIIEYLNKGY